MNEQQREHVAILMGTYADTTGGLWVNIDGELQTIQGFPLLTTFTKHGGTHQQHERACFDQLPDAEFCALAKNVLPILVADHISLEVRVGELEAKKESLRAEVKELQQEVLQAGREAYEEGQEALREAQAMERGW